MARPDREVTRKGFRDTVAAVAAAVCLLILALPVGAFAEYRIKGSGNTVITTSCYWVQGNRLFLCEGGKPVALSEVMSIEAGTFTALETEMNRDSVRRFVANVSWMQGRDLELKDRDLANLEMLAEVDELGKSPEKNHEFRSLKQACLKEVLALRKAVAARQAAWTTVRVPERPLVILGEIKSLQMLTWILSLDERRVYLETGDPTYRAYTIEHMRQSATFEPTFSRSLNKVIGDQKGSDQ